MKMRSTVIAALLSLMTTCSMRQEPNIFYIEYESVDYLTIDAPVVYHGIAVGKVKSFNILKNTHIIVQIEVDKDVQVMEDSKFAIVKFDSFGKRAIEFMASNDGVLLECGDTLRGMIVDRGPIQRLDSTEVHIALDSVLKVKSTK